MENVDTKFILLQSIWHISDSTYNLVSEFPFFEFEARQTTVKGLGLMDTYLLSNIIYMEDDEQEGMEEEEEEESTSSSLSEEEDEEEWEEERGGTDGVAGGGVPPSMSIFVQTAKEGGPEPLEEPLEQLEAASAASGFVSVWDGESIGSSRADARSGVESSVSTKPPRGDVQIPTIISRGQDPARSSAPLRGDQRGSRHVVVVVEKRGSVMQSVHFGFGRSRSLRPLGEQQDDRKPGAGVLSVPLVSGAGAGGNIKPSRGGTRSSIFADFGRSLPLGRASIMAGSRAGARKEGDKSRSVDSSKNPVHTRVLDMGQSLDLFMRSTPTAHQGGLSPEDSAERKAKAYVGTGILQGGML